MFQLYAMLHRCVRHRRGAGERRLVMGMSLLLVALGAGLAFALAPVQAAILPPETIPKYEEPLIIPPVMPPTPLGPSEAGRYGANVDYYEIAVKQFYQQVLSAGFPTTTVWGYGSVNHPGTFNYPAFTIEADYRRPVRVKWINDLKDADGNYLPHLLPVDPTLHWANPPGGTQGRDSRPTFTETPDRYMGPVPMVTHVHGAHTTQESDGYPEAWFLPDAEDIPDGYAQTGTKYDAFKDSSPFGDEWEPGAVVFQYPNDQRATTLWYHDHTLGMTRLNVYAGPSGFYLLRGGSDDMVLKNKGGKATLPGPAPQLGDEPGMRYYEIPLAIQDRSFNTDGSLFYPDTRAYFDEIAGPYIPTSDVPPIWNPEFFGNTMLVNGRTWPYLEVEPRRYRLRLLNGCNSRFLILKFSDPTLKFWQIGADGGFLPAPIERSRLLLGPAERADVIVDFSSFDPGDTITLLNLGPDEPYNGIESEPADPDTTGQVMQFKVVELTDPDTSTPPAELRLPVIKPMPAVTNTRKVSLNEMMSMYFDDAPIAAMLGTVQAVDGMLYGVPKTWDDAITEAPALGSTEVWEIYNFTADAHPIHIHQVQFEIVNRESVFGVSAPLAGENGRKDTVIAYPGQITRVKAVFDLPGLFVWHCHILEHEDNEMMRPFYVTTGVLPIP